MLPKPNNGASRRAFFLAALISLFVETPVLSAQTLPQGDGDRRLSQERARPAIDACSRPWRGADVALKALSDEILNKALSEKLNSVSAAVIN